MIDKIIETSVRSKGLVAILSLAVVIAGWLSFQSLPIDAVPDITNVQVQINTSVEGLVPEEIEKFVTFPVESGMGGMPGVEQIRSISRFGLSQVTIIFEEGTDIYLARQLVAEKLQALSGELPEGTQPQMGPITTGLGEIYFYSIEAKEPATGEARAEQLMELRALNEWFITPRLLMVKGVAEVNAIGGYEKQFFVEPNLKKLSSYGIHLDDVVSAIENNNRNTGGGYIQQTAEQLLIQASGLVRNKKDIENIVVKSLPSLRNIKIGDIAKVKLGRELRTGAALVNGKETVVGTILMLLGENSRTVSISVDEKIQEIKKTLPDWVVLNTVYNRSELVDATLGTVQGNLIFGALLVVLTLLLLVGNLRVALITAITIPLSMLSTFILMKYFNVSGNLMSLGALDFGIIIDGAVIVMDNCIRWVAQKKSELGRSLTREEVKEFVVSATKEIRSAAGFGQLIVVIVFVPLFTLTGVEGKMFIPMASAFCFALGAAFIFSFSIIPCLAGLFISRDLEAKTPWLMRKLDALYPPILEKALLMKKTVVVGGVATGALGVVLFSTLGSNFLPQQTAEQLLIQASGLVRNKKDIENIVVKSLPSLRNIKIGDIAKVKLGRELRTGAALVNGKETVVGTILMLLGENSRTVSISVDEKIQEIKKTLPDWVVLNTVYNRSELVDATLGTVQGNLIFGALLVVLTLLLLVGNLRVALITAITIPLSMLSTFILMKYFNVSGNLMSLGALDFGIIIDGAVIVMDNCIRWVAQKKSELGRSLTREEVKEFVVSATKEIRSAAGFGQLIVVIVFVPLFTLTGVEGKMFIPMASAFCFALGAAFIFSFSIIPCLAGLFISRDLEAKTPWLMRKLDALYPPILEKALLMKKTVVVGGVATGALGVVLFSTLGSNFLPQLDEGSIAIQFVRPTNISIDQSVEMQKLSEEVILEFAEVDRVVSRIGTAEIATDPMGPNISDTYVLLKDDSEWPKVDGSKRNKAKLIDALKERIEAFVPGQSLIFSQPIQLRFNELLEGVRADVSVKVFGEDMEVITEIASEIATLLQNVEGVGESEEEVKGLSPVLRITPKAEAISNLGIPKENILTTVETAIGGKEAGSLFQGVMRFPIVVRLGDEDRSNIDAIKNIPVGITDSYTEPLSEVADVKIQETYGDIRREQSKKRAAVLINVRGRDTESLVSEAQKLVSENVKVPSGYYIEWGGSFENLKEARKRLMVVVPIALMLVLFMIYMAFQSVLQTAMIAACIPMALVGGVISLMLNGLSFSISAGVGFIALSGLAVLNGIVLVSYFNKLKLSGLSGDELIREGTKMRLRPVVMTATSTVFGFIPMMVSTGMGAEVQRPLASVVVGGIISATILTLIVLPIVYRLLEDKMVVKESSISH